jgi:hypothetical protein
VFAERVGFLVLIGLVLLYAAVAAAGFPDRARIFPQLVAVAGLVSVAIELARMGWRRFVRLEDDVAGQPAALASVRAGASYVAWLLVYYVVIWVLGFLLASAIFVMLFLVLVARVPAGRALLAGVAVAGALLLLHRTLDVRWPEGRLERGGAVSDGRAVLRGADPEG